MHDVYNYEVVFSFNHNSYTLKKMGAIGDMTVVYATWKPNLIRGVNSVFYLNINNPNVTQKNWIINLHDIK